MTTEMGFRGKREPCTLNIQSAASAGKPHFTDILLHLGQHLVKMHHLKKVQINVFAQYSIAFIDTRYKKVELLKCSLIALIPP